ncbi:MAG: hypothetical protein PHS82_07090 [Lachnospiraceae bacterium]|nr:hypothetical protein [Lachnospiraceae bacterium]
MKEKTKLRWKYWAVLFNPVFVLLYVLGCRYLYLLCQYGGVRRRLPVIVCCGALGFLWLLGWTLFYLIRKHLQKVKVPGQPRIYIVLFCIEIAAIIFSTGYYGIKIFHSARDYNGKLAWKIEEIQQSRKVLLEHDNIYTDGVEGIFTDLGAVVELPEEMYLANEFSVEFDEDGTITGIYSFFYGKTADGAGYTYLLDYNTGTDEYMTVWLDGYSDMDYKELSRLNPMFQVYGNVSIRQQVQQWQDLYQAEHFELSYQEGVLSLEVPDQAEIVPMKYAADLDSEQLEKDAEQERVQQAEAERQAILNHEIGVCIMDQEEGSLTYYLDQQKGWRLIVTDAAAGSRFYELESTEDGGTTWGGRNANPFLGQIGVAEDMVFFDENNGFLKMGTATTEWSLLYMTADGGQTFTQVVLPMDSVTDAGDISAYDYMDTPYMDGENWVIAVKTEQAGEESLLFRSADHGANWEYAGTIR